MDRDHFLSLSLNFTPLRSLTRLISENPVFFGCFAFFLLGGGILLLNIETGDAIRYFSDHRATWSDLFFTYGTRLGEEYTYLLVFAIGLFVRFRYSFLILLTGFVVTGVSYGTKAFFAHDRPITYFRKLQSLGEINLIEGIELHSGATSFPSGHTMSAFALFGLLAMLVPRKRWVGLWFFVLSLIVGLSRIYLVQHFLKDVYLGAIIGIVLAMLLVLANRRWGLREERWYNSSIPMAMRRNSPQLPT